jgi:hypothetical protein
MTNTTGYEGPIQVSCGDFEKIHRCGVLAAEARAGQDNFTDIELAAAHLHGMLDALMRERART